MSVCLWVKTVGGGGGEGDDAGDTDERLAQREGKRLFAGHAGREKLFLIVTEDSLHCCTVTCVSLWAMAWWCGVCVSL